MSVFVSGISRLCILATFALALASVSASGQPAEKKEDAPAAAPANPAPAARPAPPAAPPRAAAPAPSAAPAPRAASPRPAPEPRAASPRPAPAPRAAERPAPAPRAASPRPAPAPRAAEKPQPRRPEARQERVQQRQERVRERAQQREQREDRIEDRIRQRAQQREERQDRRQERALPRDNARTATPAERREAIRDLQAKQRQELRGKSAAERRELRAQHRRQLQDLRTTERERDTRRQAAEDRGDSRRDARRDAQRERERSERAGRREQRIEQRRQARQQQRIERRAVSREEARQGRFAARYFDRAERRQARRDVRLAAREAWRRGHHAHFVAWAGPVFWPYAYTDVFYYTFWPNAYDDGYWAYAYDDFFTAVFWAYPPDYYEDVYAGPYPVPATTGSAVSVQPSAEVRRTVERVCEPDKGLSAWPFAEIERAVKPQGDQAALLDDLKAAAADAAETFKASCDPDFAMTPTGRLDGMIGRIEATLEAVRTVRPPLEKFYESLSDEQKARFNAIGPKIGANEARPQNRNVADSDNCGGSKAGLTSFPIVRIAETVRPDEKQQAALDNLGDATDVAMETLQSACPDTVALTPVGRMEAMEQRLTAMLDAAETIKPALNEFYASLSGEQKARFNSLGRKLAQSR